MSARGTDVWISKLLREGVMSLGTIGLGKLEARKSQTLTFV